MKTNNPTTEKLNALQKEAILDKLIPVLNPAPEDEGFFRGIIGIILDEHTSSAQSALFVNNLLKKQRKGQL